MYRLREMTVDDKVCEQVSMSMLSEMYPQEVIERGVQHSEPWNTKVRRVRLSTALSLVLFVIAMALWSRRNQCQVWNRQVGQTQRSASSGARECHQRFRAEWTSQGAGEPVSASAAAGALSAAGDA